jgi:hypothetical protein
VAQLVVIEEYSSVIAFAAAGDVGAVKLTGVEESVD